MPHSGREFVTSRCVLLTGLQGSQGRNCTMHCLDRPFTCILEGQACSCKDLKPAKEVQLPAKLPRRESLHLSRERLGRGSGIT